MKSFETSHHSLENISEQSAVFIAMFLDRRSEFNVDVIVKSAAHNYDPVANKFNAVIESSSAEFAAEVLATSVKNSRILSGEVPMDDGERRAA